MITVGFRDGSPPPREGDGFAVAAVAGLSPCRRLSAHAARGYWFPRSVICSCQLSVYDVAPLPVKEGLSGLTVFAGSVIALAGRTVLAHDVFGSQVIHQQIIGRAMSRSSHVTRQSIAQARRFRYANWERRVALLDDLETRYLANAG